MNIKNFFSFIFAFCLFSFSFAADKLAVAEPVGKSGVNKADLETLWGILESSINSKEYKLISRSALKQMMTEIGLTTSSDLVNLNSTQKAKLGKLEGVKYILVSEIGKFGSRMNCTMRILDSSTGEIDQERTANLRVKDLDELADKIEAALQTMLSDNKKSNACAILTPVIRPRTSSYLATDFNTRLEDALLNNGVQLQNLQSVNKILKRNNLDKLYELEPKMFVKVGKLLEVKVLIQATISRFEVIARKYYVEETGARGVRYTGVIEGNVRLVSAQNGRLLGSIPFEETVKFRELSRSETRDWTLADYGKYMIKSVVNKKIVPRLLRVSALTGEK